MSLTLLAIKTTVLVMALIATINFKIILEADKPTFTNNIKPLVEKRCAPCHTGFIDSLPNLTIYSIAYKKRFIIKSRVKSRKMPPKNSTGLTDAERQTILDWVNQGAKE